MSGQKVSYVQITENDYRRFVNASREVDTIEDRVSKQMKQREQNLRREFSNQLNSVNQRVQKQQNMIQYLSSEMQKMERDFQDNLRRLDKKIDRVDFKVDSLARDIQVRESNKQNQAQEWLKNAKDILAIVDTYNHRKFLPNEYDKLVQKLTLSEVNFTNGVFESSIANSQIIWQEAMELRVKLEELENEWNEYLKAAINSNSKLLATCDAQEIVKLAFDMEDGVQELDVEIDFWCNGELTQLKNEAIKNENELKNSANITVADFKEMIKKSSELESQVVALTQKAKDAIILSQLRSDMAEDIIQALDNGGFSLKESCFMEDDQRKSIHLKMENISGDEIVTIITPKENRENQLDIHFFGNSNENFKQTQLKNIFDRLKKANIECTAPQCAAGTQFNNSGDEKVRDFVKLQSKQELNI